jgi:hypothetical protein
MKARLRNSSAIHSVSCPAGIPGEKINDQYIYGPRSAAFSILPLRELSMVQVVDHPLTYKMTTSNLHPTRD